MTTTPKTTYTHTCDLCGAEHPRGDLRRLGRLPITEGGLVIRNPDVEATVDVCPDCQQKPIAELIAFMAEREAERAGPLLNGRFAPARG